MLSIIHGMAGLDCLREITVVNGNSFDNKESIFSSSYDLLSTVTVKYLIR